MQFNVLLIAGVMTMVLSAGQALAVDAPAAGQYSDGTLTIVLTQNTGGYTGVITSGQQQFPATARFNGATLEGSFSSGGNSYPFTATPSGDTLTLVTGGKTYSLKRAGASIAANPLGEAMPANPVAAQGTAAVSGDAPAGYAVLASTNVGKSLVTRKAGLTSIKAALEATFPELAQYLGNRPVIGRAYQDAKNPKQGGATFTAQVNGQPVQGFVKCDLNDAGATVAVIYGQTNAPKTEWDKLLNPTSANAAAPANDPGIPLKQYDFPDGTGSIGLAEGWTTKAQSAADSVGILGPANQVIILNNGRNINLPDGPAVKTRQQLQQMTEHNKAMMEANARQMEKMTGRPYPRPNLPPPAPLPPLLVAPQLDPVEALKALTPQFSAEAQFNHAPGSTLDRILSSKDVPCPLANGKAAEILYEMTTSIDGKTVHFRRLLRLMTAPLAPGTWYWYVPYGLAAPIETYDRDLPVMQAIVKSLNINKEKLAQVGQARIQQMQETSRVMADANAKILQSQREMFQDNQRTQQNIHNQQMQQMQDSFQKHNQQWANDEWQKQRQSANFQEYILGSRTVYDTKTGQSASVDLNYANGVAQSLNQATLDPNRFVAVPLRDELYPTPPPTR